MPHARKPVRRLPYGGQRGECVSLCGPLMFHARGRNGLLIARSSFNNILSRSLPSVCPEQRACTKNPEQRAEEREPVTRPNCLAPNRIVYSHVENLDRKQS